MKDYIKNHLKKYPAMEIQDLVKLIYQNEFGGGHMIKDRAASLKQLQQECEDLKKMEKGTKLGERLEPEFEDIGNGLYRLYLEGVTAWLRPETINCFFVNTAEKVKGNQENFDRKLEDVKKLCQNGELPYPLTDLELYLGAYQRNGCPAVSHSEAYRKHYHPAYRIVAGEYKKFWEIFSLIDRKLEERCWQESLLIAIDGKSGSGKSRLGQLLRDVYDCNLFHMDDFFLRPLQRTKERLREVGGNVDYERFQEEILNPLVSKEERFSYQLYDCTQQQLTEIVEVGMKKINIVEGSYSLHPYFGDPYDCKIFLDISEEEQKNRIRIRNGEEMLKRFLEEWIPKENDYFSMQQRRGISYDIYYF